MSSPRAPLDTLGHPRDDDQVGVEGRKRRDDSKNRERRDLDVSDGRKLERREDGLARFDGPNGIRLEGNFTEAMVAHL